MTHTLSTLPDEHTVYVPGLGETTLGAIRETATEQTPALYDGIDVEATCAMWEDIATRNLCRQPWEAGVTVQAVEEYHASLSLSGRKARAST